jgi:hypothetical protein
LIRSVAILAIIFSAFLLSVPSTAPGHWAQSVLHTMSGPSSIGDPNATTAAFNYTYSQQNLFTNTTSSPIPPILLPGTAATGTSFKWLTSATETKSNTPIPGTGFIFNVTSAPAAPAKQTLNWTMIIPNFNCKGCSTVNVQFDFFGNITKGTSANYTLSQTSPPHTQIGSGSYTTLGSFHANTGNGCAEDVCIDATAYRGYNVTLMFSFGWQNLTTAHGMFAELGEVTVASTGSTYHSTSNYMQIDPTNSSRVVHNANLSSITYNGTLTTVFHPGTGNLTKDWWQTEGINIYYPAGYRLKQAYVNTSIFIPNANEVPLDSKNCVPGTSCSQSLLALNVSDYARIAPRNITITIVMGTDNSISPLQPVSGGVPSIIYAPGDTLGLKTIIKPSITNASIIQQIGKLDVVFYDKANSSHILAGQSFPTLTSAGAVYNVTLPSDCSGNNCGLWTVRANFNSSYDLGQMSTTFKIDQLQIGTFSSSGSNSGLHVQGSLTNSTGSPASTASGVVFAVDSESTASYPSAPTTNTTSVGLYVTNVTLVNGVFSQGQSLIMTFTIVNSNSSAPAYNANVTIEHDWPGSPPQAHGLNGNFSLGVGHLGDLSFTRGPQSYQATFTITGSGIELKITSLSTGNFETVSMSKGSNPVSPTEPHTGLFKITIVTLSSKTVVSTSSTYSPPYAYVYGLPFSPSRYLAYSSPFSGSTFSTTIKSDSILGAKKLVVFALARDASGTILSNNSQNPGLTDSTTLQSSMDQIGEVAENQQVTAVLHLTSNSTTLSQNITVNLNLQNAGVVGTQTGIIIAHGASESVSLSFTAPSSPGQYTLSFSSPQYNGGVALATQTLKVTIAGSNLQILIPALIGVVAAIIVLGVYLIRRKPPVEAEEVTRKSSTGPKTKPTSGGNPASKSLTRTGPL